MTTISDMNPPSEPPLHSPIIACIDFSEDSRAALIWACRMADNSGGTLILLHIVHDLASHPGFYHPEKSNHLEPMQDVAQSMMDDFLEQMRSRHPDLASLATAGIRLVPGLPATRIVEIAGLLNASLLVMGAHGMASHSHRRLGSVVEQLTARRAFAGNGAPLPRGATPRTTASRPAQRELPRCSNTALQSLQRTCHFLRTAPCPGTSG
jgi:nucleotide-binding universal stress UspA family protein